jgi:hypothetical protein
MNKAEKEPKIDLEKSSEKDTKAAKASESKTFKRIAIEEDSDEEEGEDEQEEAVSQPKI